MSAKSRTHIKVAAVILSLVTIAIACCPTVGMSLFGYFFGLRGADLLEYPDGITFSSTADKDHYTHLSWHATSLISPEPCPITIHLPNGDLRPEDLASMDTLKTRGWTEGQPASNVTLSDEHGTFCSFENEKLTGVRVSTVTLRGEQPQTALITLSGKTIKLPASEAAIIEVLGPPIGKHSFGRKHR